MKLKRCVGENNIEADGIKQIVKKKYGEIAAQGKPHSACSCCSPTVLQVLFTPSSARTTQNGKATTLTRTRALAASSARYEYTYHINCKKLIAAAILRNIGTHVILN